MRRRLVFAVLLPIVVALVRLVASQATSRRRSGLPRSSVVESTAPDAFGAAVTEAAERRSR